ncbi:MAG: formate dehydrogenase accessory sulfurtransferase FdhD [Actinobacteria bacterium]|nr:formate dehydrogenase accessory sulfurtransferase FdhD [Actinomycetota bacterium]
MRRATADARVLAVGPHGARERPDRLVTEEPMEIRAGGPGQEPVSVAVTMRTPGHDFELAVGFLLAEGLLQSGAEVSDVRYCRLPDGEEQLYNIVTVGVRHRFELAGHERRFHATASCGLCGKQSLDQIGVAAPPLAPGPVVAASAIAALPDRLRVAQRVFDKTGGLHAAGLADGYGEVVSVREDVGRHNAVDKLVGEAALGGRLPLSNSVLVVSGRISFEIVQKAAVAGIPVLCAVSAPSSLAVDAATRLGMTLAGFVRDGSFNVYSGAERVDVRA